MTRIDFYTGVDNKQHVACQLSQKAVESDMRVVLYTPDLDTTVAMDKLLWEHTATSFIPHCRRDAPEAYEMPVVVGHQSADFPHHDVLINLNTACLPFFSRFKRVIEIVSPDQADVVAARERFSFYRDRGYEIRHFDLSKQTDLNNPTTHASEGI